jgi:hypothetical protein
VKTVNGFLDDLLTTSLTLVCAEKKMPKTCKKLIKQVALCSLNILVLILAFPMYKQQIVAAVRVVHPVMLVSVAAVQMVHLVMLERALSRDSIALDPLLP